MKYFGKKLLWYLLTLFVAILLNFLLPRLIPGNPVAVILNDLTSGMTDTNSIKRIYEAFNAQFGLDKPLWQQFWIYLKNLFNGDLGISFGQYPRPVSDIIGSAIPWTIMLQLPAIVIGWLLGNLIGARAAYRRGVFDKAIFPTFLFISAIPPFGLAIVMIWIFASNLHWLPGSLGYGFDLIINWGNPAFILSVLQHYILPFITLTLVIIGSQSLGMREMSIYELNADYVKYSRLMGIKDKKIVGYVFRNAMLPQITGLALSLGTMIGGSLITEIVFSYPGLGTTMFSAIKMQDFPLISGCTLIVTVTVLAANFIVDILCGIIDPRVKMTQQEEG